MGPPEEESHSIYKVEAILFGLGFSQADLGNAPRKFSGGFQIRINLAKLLLSEPNLLLLDEPTNYLDITSVRWITILVELQRRAYLDFHDRDFMDRVTTPPRSSIARKSASSRAAPPKLTRKSSSKTRFTKKPAPTKKGSALTPRLSSTDSEPKRESQNGPVAHQRCSREFPSLRRLPISSLLISNLDTPRLPKLCSRRATFHSAYTPDHLLFRHMNLTINARDKFGAIGNNGKGKSTLLNVISSGLIPVTGEIKVHPDMRLGYFGQTNIQRLNPKLTIEAEIEQTNPALTRTQVRNICGTMMFGGDLALKKVAVLSGGESRTLLGKILAHPSNLLLLDEPNNHLDMESIDALIESLQGFPGALLIVTHNERILRALATKLIVFHRGKVDVFNSGYDEFLEKIGWEEETDGTSAQKNPHREILTARKRT